MQRKHPLTIDEFKNIYSKVPRLVVCLVVLDEKGVLLTLRKKHGWEGQWHMPGGTVHYLEPIEEAVSRVAKEELDIEVKIEKLLGYLEYKSEVKERGYGYAVSLVFLVRPLSFDIKLDEDVEKYDFFKDLPEKMVIEEKEFISKQNLL